jgi:hypothetical protein
VELTEGHEMHLVVEIHRYAQALGEPLCDRMVLPTGNLLLGTVRTEPPYWEPDGSWKCEADSPHVLRLRVLLEQPLEEGRHAIEDALRAQRRVARLVVFREEAA